MDLCSRRVCRVVVVSSWSRRGLVVASSWPRRRQLVNSLPSGKALGGVFCGLLLLRPKTPIALSRLCEMAPTRVFSARPRPFCVAGAIDLHHLAASCCVFSANRIVSAAQSGDTVQIPSQAWHFVTCDENRRKPRTKRRF